MSQQELVEIFRGFTTVTIRDEKPGNSKKPVCLYASFFMHTASENLSRELMHDKFPPLTEYTIFCIRLSIELVRSMTR